MILHKQKNNQTIHSLQSATYSTRYWLEPIPQHEIPKRGMPADAAYQLIHDELNLDSNPDLNLASFVTTWMEPEALKLIAENLHKNFIDHDEYPQTEIMHERCINMLANLFNSPPQVESIGTATIGSSEAIMLALLSHKWNWKKAREKAGKRAEKPNIIFGADAHVCWEKFATYFEVEMRIVPLEAGRYHITGHQIAPLIDENTMAVGAILGTTYTGHIDAIQEINQLLLQVKKEQGLDIPLHIDAASGGFIIPFTKPDFVWDFRLPQVKSINVSGHKYGLVYPGIGWVLWKDAKELPQELIFKVNYLNGWMPTYTLNFSCSSIGIIGQYYNFLRLGHEGYKRIMNNCLLNAQYLGKKLVNSQYFECINDATMLPILTLKLTDQFSHFSVFDIMEKIRSKGWVLAAYTLPIKGKNIAVLRIVVREHFSRDMADILSKDIIDACLHYDNKRNSAFHKA